MGGFGLRLHYVGDFKCGKVESKPVGFGMWSRSGREPCRDAGVTAGNVEAESGLRDCEREEMTVKMAAAQHPKSLWLHRGWREQNGRFCPASTSEGWLDHDFEFVVGEFQLSVVAEGRGKRRTRGDGLSFLNKSKRTTPSGVDYMLFLEQICLL